MGPWTNRRESELLDWSDDIKYRAASAVIGAGYLRLFVGYYGLAGMILDLRAELLHRVDSEES